MIIHGLQKLTTLDYPEKLACTVFCNSCNFRCPFCHNARLVTHPDEGDRLDEKEVLSYIEKRKGMLDGVCITGGEPTLQKDLIDFMRKIKEIGLLVKLDTNGYEPQRLRQIIEAGVVDYVAMDIKNSPARYAETVGLSTFDYQKIKQSIALLLENKVDYEFRTTLVNELHTLSDIKAIASEICGAKRWYLQKFTDSGDLIGTGLTPPTNEFMKNAQSVVQNIVQNVELRGI